MVTSHDFVLISFGSVEKFILKKSVVMSSVVDPIPHPITGDPETRTPEPLTNKKLMLFKQCGILVFKYPESFVF